METDEIKNRYAKRDEVIKSDRYSMRHAHIRHMYYERTETIISLLTKYVDKPLENIKILEVGCGKGENLSSFLSWGIPPENISGNDLIEERICFARKRLPMEVKLECGDASKLGNRQYDVVFASTVFTSILDKELRQQLACHMWDMVAEGGAVLYYDFIFSNPKVTYVKSISLNEIKKLFPNGKFYYKRVTLAPPLGKFVLDIIGSTLLYRLLLAIPLLRTHVMCVIKK